MKRKNLLRKFALAVLPAVLFQLLSCTEQDYKFVEKYEVPSQEKIDRQVDSVFRTLTTREKIAQLMVIDMTSMDSKEEYRIQKRLVRKEKIGGLIPLGYDDYRAAVKKINRLNRLAKIPMLMTIDGEWGVSMRWKGVPGYHGFLQMGALGSDTLVYEVGRMIGLECRAHKLQVNYSPVVDLNNNPDKFIVGGRSFGENKEKVTRYAIAMMKGLQDGGVAGSAKHFPGHGETDVDSHKALPFLPFTAERIDSLELYPFKKLIAEGVDMVMVGHLSIPALDSTGTPSSISKPIVTGLLREKLGFDGIICTDGLDMYGVSKHSGLAKKEIPLAAYKAGVDILLIPEDVEASITMIEQALERGEITMEGLDMRVKKILALKARFGLFDEDYDPYINMKMLDQFTDMDLAGGYMEAKLDLMKKVAKNSMTVVFNDNSDGNGIPVSLKGKKVAYVGYRNPELGHEFGTLAKRYGDVDTILLGADASLAELKRAKERVAGHDLVIFGYNKTDQRRSRGYSIVPEEINFITDWAAEQPMIAVYLGTSYALTHIPGHKNFKAYVVGYLDTQVNNFAAAQVVFGGVPANGVLPVTSASFKEGESVIIPGRYREEYHHFIGSRKDKESMAAYDMKGESPLYTAVPQVAELVACGKIQLSQTLSELLETNDSDASVTVEELLKGWRDNTSYSQYMHALLGKYRGEISVEEAAVQMFDRIGMTSTKVSGTEVITNGIDLNKYLFTVNNGGKYAGEQILSSDAADLILKFSIR